jgi:hypothetical protein
VVVEVVEVVVEIVVVVVGVEVVVVAVVVEEVSIALTVLCCVSLFYRVSLFCMMSYHFNY